jgi:hypothetical protein
MRGRRRAAFAALSLLVLLGLAGAARAHTAGSGTITLNGSFVLSPVEAENNSFHAYLASLGLPIGAGDTLKFLWQANAGHGPPVFFEIHAHPPPSGYVVYYNKTAVYVSDSWSVPGNDAYMVYWLNENSAAVNVTYKFDLVPPPDSTALLLSIPLGVATVGVALWLLRGKLPKPPEKGIREPK